MKVELLGGLLDGCIIEVEKQPAAGETFFVPVQLSQIIRDANAIPDFESQRVIYRATENFRNGNLIAESIGKK